MSYKPQTLFSGSHGEASTDKAGPVYLTQDLQELAKMFDPNSVHRIDENHPTAEPGGINKENLAFTITNDYDNTEKSKVATSYTHATTQNANPHLTKASQIENSEITGVQGTNVQTTLGGLKDVVDTKATITSLTNHTTNTGNPHGVTKAQVGLGNVDNTADVNKSVKDAGKVRNALTFGNKTFDGSSAQTLVKADIGLGNVDNTADLNKTVKEAGKVSNALSFGAKTFDGSSAKEIVKSDLGLGNVDNTSDANKPISSATASALALKESTADADLLLKNVTYTSADGKFTFTKQGGGTIVIDTNLEKVPGSMVLVEDPVGSGTYYLVIYDTSVPPIELSRCPVTSLFNAIEVEDTSTIHLVLATGSSGKKKLTSNVIAGSIGASHLDSTLAGRITTLESNAINSITDSNTIDLTISNHDLTASVKDGSITNAKLDSTLAGRITTLENKAIASVTDSSTIDFTFNSTTHDLTASVKDGSVTSSKLDTTLNNQLTSLSNHEISSITDSGTIDFTFSNHDLTAIVKDGSITTTKLDPTVLTTIESYATRAETAASNASTSATNAESYKDSASTYAGNASTSASEASVSASNASTYAGNASTYAGNASASADTASTHATTAGANATLSESWAVGGTGTRSGEDTNNAKYWCEQAASTASADMKKSVYDPEYAVQTAGGIPNYVSANGGKIDKIKVNGTEQAIVSKVVDLAVYEKPASGIPSTDMTSAVQTSLGKADTALQSSALTPYRTASAQDAIDLAMKNDIDAIESKIPSEATSSNQLADKSFVNSSISTNTATFRGTSASGLTEAQFIEWANGLTKTNNDYVFWNTVDANNNVVYKRYKYNGTEWVYEYSLNNSSFTAAQWSTINSGITSDKVSGYDTHVADTTIHVTSSDKSTWNSKYAKPSGGIPDSDIASAITWNAKSNKAISFTVSLSSSGWSNNAQTVSDNRFDTSGFAYIVAPEGASFGEYTNAMIYASEVSTAGQMTFNCAEVPTNNITVTILKVEVA